MKNADQGLLKSRLVRITGRKGTNLRIRFTIRQAFARVETRVESSRLCLISKWLPQRHILNHSVYFQASQPHPVGNLIKIFIGYRMNSVLEALGGGTPMIFWPSGADQPAATNQIEAILKQGSN
ncbi:hypothetical protein CVT25_000378 [Psilocybe cyanescens]|uniref:Uncharacterized protein n=1 Tax=Psilocybe cyanescens TaxID=93625 RepID=A0A409XEZ0_PSICY|nr:hypothetical protein CVT25_000378 [Psilocybe cyanescens]